MIDFSGPTDVLYDLYGQTATYISGGTSIDCTVLMDFQGEERADRGVVETAVIRVRASEVSDPKRADQFNVDGRTWRVEFRLGADDGTNELESALSCISTTHLGVGL